jgi:hypothetical protein
MKKDREPKSDRSQEQERTGVWVENGIVYRRDSLKWVSPSQYVPKKPELLAEVVASVRSIQNIATMDSWDHQVEAQQDERQRELEKIIKPQPKTKTLH